MTFIRFLFYIDIAFIFVYFDHLEKHAIMISIRYTNYIRGPSL